MSKIAELLEKGKLKRGTYSAEMCEKEYNIAKKDLESAKRSYEDENYKWATIQAYYAIFHGVRALIYKAGYREESHAALKLAFKELYIDTGLLSQDVYITLERGMNLREMADYKENYSQIGASNLIEMVVKGISEIEKEME
ncbi:MAG: HEPN domain-containing protein [Ignavibacteriales bacterium]